MQNADLIAFLKQFPDTAEILLEKGEEFLYLVVRTETSDRAIRFQARKFNSNVVDLLELTTEKEFL